MTGLGGITHPPGGGTAATPAAQMPPENIVTPFDPPSTAGFSNTGTNWLAGARVVVRKTGTLHDFAVMIGSTTAGNIRGAIFDTGATTSGVRTRLWESGSVAAGAINLWQVLGDPAVAVTAGQQLDFVLIADNSSVLFARRGALGVGLVPAGFLGGSVEQFTHWTINQGSFVVPATIAAATVTATTNQYLSMARVT